eukprot:c18718_g1_i1 orf=85-399(+)
MKQDISIDLLKDRAPSGLPVEAGLLTRKDTLWPPVGHAISGERDTAEMEDPEWMSVSQQMCFCFLNLIQCASIAQCYKERSLLFAEQRTWNLTLRRQSILPADV